MTYYCPNWHNGLTANDFEDGDEVETIAENAECSFIVNATATLYADGDTDHFEIDWGTERCAEHETDLEDDNDRDTTFADDLARLFHVCDNADFHDAPRWYPVFRTQEALEHHQAIERGEIENDPENDPIFTAPTFTAPTFTAPTTAATATCRHAPLTTEQRERINAFVNGRKTRHGLLYQTILAATTPRGDVLHTNYNPTEAMRRWPVYAEPTWIVLDHATCPHLRASHVHDAWVA